MILTFKPDFILRVSGDDIEDHLYAVAGVYEGQTEERFKMDWKDALEAAILADPDEWSLTDVTERLRKFGGWKIHFIKDVVPVGVTL